MHTGTWWGNPRGKRPLGITRHRWEDNIKIGLHVVGWGSHRLDLSGS